ncbi:MAG: hypothetical protein GC168_09835 [Candidatus Hydrogenedens sp.]|nr:hypothetical protein [Candidatus Hydrogenedens sp.]
MQLSPDQERFIAVYLRDVALHIDREVEDSRAQRGLELLERRIRAEIAQRTSEKIMDSDVVRVLDELGAPEDQARGMQAGGSAAKPKRDDGPRPVWLGVCAFWADQLGIPVAGLRALCFVAGLITGPLAVSIYIAAYGVRWWGFPKDARPIIDWVRMGWNVATAIIIAILLARAGSLFLWAVDWGYERVFDEAVPALGQWGWIKGEAPGYYSMAVFCAVPLAVLSGLPLANGWDYSVKRLYLAILTLYGVMLSYGAASYLVGIALQLSEQSGGFNFFQEFLSDLPKNLGS